MQGVVTAIRQGSRYGLLFLMFLIGFAAPPVANADMTADPDQWRGESETRVTCVKEPGPGPVELSALGGNGADLRFVRSGDEMVIFEENYLHGVVSCGPGSLALDEITEVRLVSDDVVYDSSFTIDLSQGPFTPGAGPDDSTPEIEFDLPIQTSFNSARFEGVGALPEPVYVGRRGNEAAADLNGDGDADVRWQGAENALVGGTPGDDRIDLTGKHADLGAAYNPYRFSVSAREGDDEIILGSGGVYDLYDGGPGDDVFRLAGPSEAVLDGGDGDDTVILGPGTGNGALSGLQSVEHVVRAGQARAVPASVRIVAARVPEAAPGLRRRGVSLRVYCSQACSARVEISTGRRAVRQGMPWVLGTRFVSLGAGERRWVTIPLRPLARRALADNRPWRFNIKNWAKATFADGTIRQDWFVSEVG